MPNPAKKNRRSLHAEGDECIKRKLQPPWLGSRDRRNSNRNSIVTFTPKKRPSGFSTLPPSPETRKMIGNETRSTTDAASVSETESGQGRPNLSNFRTSPMRRSRSSKGDALHPLPLLLLPPPPPPPPKRIKILCLLSYSCYCRTSGTHFEAAPAFVPLLTP